MSSTYAARQYFTHSRPYNGYTLIKQFARLKPSEGTTGPLGSFTPGLAGHSRNREAAGHRVPLYLVWIVVHRVMYPTKDGNGIFKKRLNRCESSEFKVESTATSLELVVKIPRP